MATSRDQVTRLLTLIPYLQSVRQADLVETAERFGVSAKQLIADLKVLWFCGLPGGLPGDLIDIDFDSIEEGVIRLTNAEYLSRPMRLRPDEIYALIAALEVISELVGSQNRQAVDSALAKLSAQGRLGSERIKATIAVASGSLDIRQQLLDAIAAQLVVRLTYDAQADQVTTYPTVAPNRIVSRDGYAYLQAWSLERQAWRTYRLDRIAQVDITEQVAEDYGEPEPFDVGWLERRGSALVELKLKKSAAWVGEYYPVESIRNIRDGVLVKMLVADPAWLRGLLLRLGEQVIAVKPAQVASSTLEAAQEALVAYGVG